MRKTATVDTFSSEKYSTSEGLSRLRPRILASFHRHGVRCTSQRYAILEYLLRNRTHPTAEEIHTAINRADPRASLATVYKALHAMANAGLIREMNLGGGAVRFESHIDRHHHFVCENCGDAEDIPWFDLPELIASARVGMRKVKTYELVLRGLCEACSRS